MTAITPLDTSEGTRLTIPADMGVYFHMVVDATPDFYLEHINASRNRHSALLRALSCPLPGVRGTSDPPRLPHGAGERFLQHGAAGVAASIRSI